MPGRDPHMYQYDAGCREQARAVLLGATNSWFPITLSALAIPLARDPISQLVQDGWDYSRTSPAKPKWRLAAKIFLAKLWIARLPERAVVLDGNGDDALDGESGKSFRTRGVSRWAAAQLSCHA